MFWSTRPQLESVVQTAPLSAKAGAANASVTARRHNATLLMMLSPVFRGFPVREWGGAAGFSAPISKVASGNLGNASVNVRSSPLTLEPVPGLRLLMDMNAELLVGDVARQTGVSVDTVRHYERKGILQNVRRDDSGYRRYAPDVVARIAMV